VAVSARRRGKLIFSILAILLAMALLPLLIVSWRLVAINRETLSANQRALQLQLAQAKAREIELFTSSCYGRAAGLARALELAGNSALANPGNGLRGAMNDDPALLALAVIPSDGDYSAVYDTTRLGLADLEPLLEESTTAASSGVGYLGSPRILPASLAAVAPMAVPVRGDGKVAGMVVAVVDMEQPFRFVAPDARSRTTAETLASDQPLFFIVDAKGVVVAHPDQQPVLESRSLRDNPLVNEWVEQGRQIRDLTREFDATIGDQRFALLGAIAAAELPESRRLGVAAIVNRDIAFASVDRMAAQTLWAALFAAAIAALVAILFAGHIASPIVELARSARAVADGDFSVRTRIWRNDETGQLADDFNRMADRLQGYVDALKEAATSNRALFIGTVRALAAAIDGKDPYTRGHSERVAQYSEAIATEMGLDADEVEKVRVGGLMHDLGKIGIEDKILRKPAPLTDAEYEIMKNHPDYGAKIMSEIPQMRDFIAGMRFHHEMMDGRGYPLGLAGEQIPLMARIVAVADTFDAMTTNRPYQKQMEIEVVFERIRAFAGSRYDPRVVEALVAAYEHGRIKLRRAQSSAQKTKAS
jgi:putative nucleotidyltransferase with HDIG domain